MMKSDHTPVEKSEEAIVPMKPETTKLGRGKGLCFNQAQVWR
jgi:hypothetical protein